MITTSASHLGPRVRWTGLTALVGLVWFLLPAQALATPQPVTPPQIPGIAGLPGPVAAAAVPSPQGLKLLKATPDTGPPGTPFVLTGSGLPPSTDLDITWSTATKQYIMDVVPDSVDFYGRKFSPTTVVLAKGRTDASGNLSLNLKFPQDYGALHDIYAVAGGVQLAKGGVLVERTYSVSPLKGAIGTEITIKLNGLGWLGYMDTVAVIWDNRYAGFLSSVTTRGQATATIRAAGPPGKHTLELVPASATTPFLNITQSAVGYLGFKRYTFTVTKDAGPPPTKVVWPLDLAPTSSERTTFRTATIAGVNAKVSTGSGTVGSKVQLTASGLAPGAAVIQWNTAVGTRTGAGYSNSYTPLANVTIPASGNLDTTLTVPDDVGGWHTIEVLQGGATKASVPYRIDQSLFQGGINGTKFKRGDRITIHFKGVGFTEMDNILAVTVDNAYIGYVCGFFSAGDTVLDMVASGEPGTHLVDFYPTIYKQQKGGNDIWYGATPFLTYRTDYPLLALGYRLPAYHFAYTIVK